MAKHDAAVSHVPCGAAPDERGGTSIGDPTDFRAAFRIGTPAEAAAFLAAYRDVRASTDALHRIVQHGNHLAPRARDVSIAHGDTRPELVAQPAAIDRLLLLEALLDQTTAALGQAMLVGGAPMLAAHGALERLHLVIAQALYPRTRMRPQAAHNQGRSRPRLSIVRSRPRLVAPPVQLARQASAAPVRWLPAEQPALVEQLSAREHEVLALIAQGAPNSAIADTLALSVHTVKRHASNILAKLSAANRTQAVAYARAYGLLPAAPPAPMYRVSAQPQIPRAGPLAVRPTLRYRLQAEQRSAL